MVRVVDKKLAQDLETRNVRSQNQGKYTTGKATRKNSARFVYDVSEGFQRTEQTLVVAVDLEDAYSKMQFKLLVEFLVQYDIGLTLTRWLAGAILERKVTMRLGN